MEGLTIVYCCIAPHGGEVIPEIAKGIDLRRFEPTRRAMRQLAKKIRSARPDTIVLATPHNLRLYEKIGIVTAENSSGRLGGAGREVFVSAKCDVKFAMELLRVASKAGLPVVGANYGTDGGASSNMPMDWGTLVPLWFVLKEDRMKCKIVIVTPSREIPLRRNFEFGRVLGGLAGRSRKRLVFVASADQAHSHKKEGPYGFSREASAYDGFVVEAIKKNRLKSILGLKRRFVEDAKPDSLWQMAILAGILDRVEMISRVYSYQVPTYYGMICAGFSPTPR